MSETRPYTTFCGVMEAKSGMTPDSPTEDTIEINQVWHHFDLIAECIRPEDAELVADALNFYHEHTNPRPKNEPQG